MTLGADISCLESFGIGKKWLLLCISHIVGCRYDPTGWHADAAIRFRRTWPSEPAP